MLVIVYDNGDYRSAMNHVCLVIGNTRTSDGKVVPTGNIFRTVMSIFRNRLDTSNIHSERHNSDNIDMNNVTHNMNANRVSFCPATNCADVS